MKPGGAILRAARAAALAGLAFGLLPPVGRAGLIADGAPAARSFGGVTRAVTARDGRGRPTELTTAFGGATPLVEAVTRRPDGRLASLAISRGAGHPMAAEDRQYEYDGRNRLVRETLWNSDDITHQFDGGEGDGPGVITLTSAAPFGGDPWQVAENCPGQFARVTGFEYLAPPEFRSYTYDAAGQRTEQEFNAGEDHALSLYAWDAFGRLVRCQFDSRSPYAWTAAYDGLGRRLTATNGGGAPECSVYDPAVEFLELEVRQGAAVARKLYGPDGSGAYGGHQGVGGLLAVFQGAAATPTAMVEDRFGNCVGRVAGGTWTWTYTDLVGYGPASRWQPLPSRDVADLSATLIWQGRAADPTGFVWMGARYFDPQTRTFLSADPLGHSASLSLYDYADGDPINRIDPDGRFGKSAFGIDTIQDSCRLYGTATADFRSDGLANKAWGATGYLLATTAIVVTAADQASNLIPGKAAVAGSLAAVGKGLVKDAGLQLAETGLRFAARNADDAVPVAARGTPFESMLAKVDTLDFSTPVNKAVFYSGPGQGARATAFAGRTGGMTIEMTPGGQFLTENLGAFTRAEQNAIWQRASVPFAEGASGRINAFIHGADPARTFRTIEEPIINSSSSIWGSTYHY